MSIFIWLKSFYFFIVKKNNLPLFLQKANFNSVNMLICTKKLDVEKFKGNNFINLKKLILNFYLQMN